MFTIVCLMLGTAIVAFLLNKAWVVAAVLTPLTALGLTWIRRRFILGRTIRLAGVRGDVLLLVGVDADVAQEVRGELSSRRVPKPARRA